MTAIARALGACSLLLPDSQCSTDGDCTKKGGAFAGSVCTDGACTRTDATDGGVQPGAECTSNASCGASAICGKGGRCASLLSDDCLHVIGDPSSDQAIVIGSILKIAGTDLGGSPSIQAGMELARDEITSAAGGLPATRGGFPRPLVIVECNQVVDPVRAARHLAEDVGVPAIIGASNSGTTTQIATQVTIPDGVLLFSPTATSPTLTSLNDNGLVWRASPSDTFQGKAMTLLYPSLEKRVTDGDPSAEGHVHVALASKGDAYGKGLRDVLVASLIVNGQPAQSQTANFFAREYPNTDEVTNYDFSTLIGDITQFRPQIVIIAGTSEGLTILKGIENAPDAGAGGPLYLLTDGLVNPDLPTYIDSLPPSAAASLRARTLGVIPGNSRSANFQSFRFRFTSRYGSLDPVNASFGYDSLYIVAYGIVASQAAPVTGAAIATGLKKVTGTTGTTETFGETSVNPTIDLLLSGQSINVDGASGPLDFDPDTGDTIGDIDIEQICAGAGGAANAWSSSGLYYDSVKGALAGSIATCP